MASGDSGVCDSSVTWARTRGSGMIVLPVAAATASMTWPISASLKFGVMRWPLFAALFCAPTIAVAVKAHSAVRRATRKGVLLIRLNCWVLVCCYSRAASFPGRRLDGRLVHGDIAIAALSELV